MENKKEIIKFISNSPQGTIFTTPDWLEAVAPGRWEYLTLHSKDSLKIGIREKTKGEYLSTTFPTVSLPDKLKITDLGVITSSAEILSNFIKEDHYVEYDVINRLDPNRMLMIGSGGCIALSIKTTYPDLDLNVIDSLMYIGL